VRRGLIVIALIGVALALPAGAAAKAADKPSLSLREETITFPGTEGFRFKVELIEIRGPKRSISAGSVKARRGNEAGEYPKVESSHVSADGSASLHIAGVGRLDLSFHPTKTKHMPLLTFCPGSPTTYTEGTLSGRIDLRGRRGFTTARRAHAEGKLIDFGSFDCLFPTKPGSKGRPALPMLARADESSPETLLPLTGVRAERRKPGLVTSFSAGEIRFGRESAGPFYVARATTHAHGVEFVGSIAVDGGESIFAGPPLEPRSPLTIEPPSPFADSSDFELLSSHRATSTGDLSADLPGFGEVSLAGPKFKATICEEERCRGNAEPPDVDELLGLPTFGLAPPSRLR
jgi:hypothetical protein